MDSGQFYIYHLCIVLSSNFQLKTVMPAFLYKLLCSYEWPLGLPRRLNPLSTVGKVTIKTFLGKDLVTTTVHNLWLHSFYYSVRTLMYFLREVFQSCKFFDILKIPYWVTELVNLLSGVFESLRGN